MADKILFSIEIDNTGAIKKIDQTRKAIGEDLPKSTEKASAGMSKLQDSLKMVGAAFGALAVVGIVKLTRELVGLAGSVIQTGARFETMAIQMRAVTGSSEAARVAMNWITEFTASTPYQLEQVTDAFVRMRAMGLDPMDGTMQAVADMTSYLGGSMETMNSIVLALGKSYTVGKMSMEEMRMMMERGVPVIDILADKLGVTNQKIVEMSAKGQLGRDAINLLIEGMGELAGGASASLMDSYTGLWSNLQDHITLALKEMSEGGLLDAAKAGLKSLVDILKDLRESGVIEYFGKALSETLSSAIPIIDTAAAGLKTFALGLVAIKQMAATVNLEMSTDAIKQLNKEIEIYADKVNKGGRFTEHWKKKLLEAYIELIKAEKVQKAANKSWDDADEVLQRLTGQIVATKDAVGGGGSGGGGGLTESLGDVTKATVEWNDSMWQGPKYIEQYLTAGRQFTSLLSDMTISFYQAEQAGRNMAIETDDSFGMMEHSFSDLISKGFTGELDSFSDIWENIWADMAKSMTTILGKAFSEGFKTDGNLFEKFSAGFKGMWNAIVENPEGAAITGAGGVYQATQQGGAAGIVMGALSGAMTGAAISSIITGATIGSAFPVVGTIIGAVVGAAIAYFGGKAGEKSPRVYGGISASGVQQISQHDTDLSVQERAVLGNDIINRYRENISAYRSLLRLFDDPELFDLINRAPNFTFDEAGWDAVQRMFEGQFLPDAMRAMFEGAINAGMTNFGVSDATQQRLWEELQRFSGSDLLDRLVRYITAVVETSGLLEGMEWNTILDASRQDSMTSFLLGMADTLAAVQNQMFGLDDMTLLERADQASTINQLMLSARQAEIQMLQQIDQLQKSINDSIDSQIEGIRLGGMTEGQQQDYYLEKIQDIMAQLRAGVSSPEAVQALMADLQRYTGAYGSSLGDALYTQAGWGSGTEADWIIGILEEARGLSNDAFESMRDQIRESNDALVAELQKLIEALTHYGDSAAAAASERATQAALDVTGRIDVEVRAGDGFWADVDARFDYLLRQRQQIEGGIN